MEPIKLFVVEDQAKILKNQLKLLDGVEDLRILGSAMTGEDALVQLEQSLPDVVLCDLGLPGISGIEVTRNLKSRHPEVEVLIFTIFDEEEKVLDAIRAGAAGYLLKGATTDKIVEAIKDVHTGGTVIQPSLARRLLRHFNAEGPAAALRQAAQAAPAGQKKEETPALTPRESECRTPRLGVCWKSPQARSGRTSSTSTRSSTSRTASRRLPKASAKA
jgi:DNA-binding NarL/FixJ family response regulator